MNEEMRRFMHIYFNALGDNILGHIYELCTYYYDNNDNIIIYE
jgi:hypothetical protein